MGKISPAEELWNSIREFVGAYQERQNLKKLNPDWNGRIKVLPTDQQFVARLEIVAGSLSIVENGEAELNLLGLTEDLISLFWGAVMASQLYKQGKIRIIGSEEDLLWLDLAILQIG